MKSISTGVPWRSCRSSDELANCCINPVPASKISHEGYLNIIRHQFVHSAKIMQARFTSTSAITSKLHDGLTCLDLHTGSAWRVMVDYSWKCLVALKSSCTWVVRSRESEPYQIWMNFLVDPIKDNDAKPATPKPLQRLQKFQFQMNRCLDQCE